MTNFELDDIEAALRRGAAVDVDTQAEAATISAIAVPLPCLVLRPRIRETRPGTQWKAVPRWRRRCARPRWRRR